MSTEREDKLFNALNDTSLALAALQAIIKALLENGRVTAIGAEDVFGLLLAAERIVGPAYDQASEVL